MEFFKIKKDIPFMRYALWFNVVSLVTFLLSVFFLYQRGLAFSIEFTGGTDVQVSFAQPPHLDRIRQAVEGLGYHEVPLQQFGSANELLIRLPSSHANAATSATPAPQQASQAVEQMMNAIKKIESSAQVRRVEFVGPQVGRELATNGLIALLVVVVGIIIYLAFRFERRLALSTIIANLHDIIIILGFFAFFQWEFSLSVLAGVLAILGYSVNESVVVFDRVRENFRVMRTASIAEIMDNSITKNISRTIITHGSTQIMVLTMLIFGGPALHNFSLALTIGILFGIYSSVFVSCPLAMYMGVERTHFIIKPKDKTKHPDGAVV